MTLLDQHPATRPARPIDRDAAVRVLAEAFQDDPVLAWMVPEPVERRRVLGPVFDLFVGAFARHDETHVVPTADVVAAVALWAPPGVEAIHPDDEEVFSTRMEAIAGEHMARLAICTEMMAEAHPEEPAWYLQFLAVDPLVQGMGLGSVALREVLARADAAGQPAYLEATSARNRAFYLRHGFRDVGEIALPGGPTMHAMWREPVITVGPPID